MPLFRGRERLRAGASGPGAPASTPAGARPASDQELVRASLLDPNAYAGVVRRYERSLKRYLARLLGRSAQQVEDVLQEVFLKAYVNLNDYERERPFAPWIYRIAHNEAMSVLRRRRSEPHTISGEDGRLVLERVAGELDAGRDLDAAQDEARLHAALAGLDGKYRDVIVLRYLEDMSYDDIADVLALPAGTVATLLNRGKQRLRLALDAADAGAEARR
jgi:RNA polymerase sigma-70 factor (ECF subfamily)